MALSPSSDNKNNFLPLVSLSRFGTESEQEPCYQSSYWAPVPSFYHENQPAFIMTSFFYQLQLRFCSSSQMRDRVHHSFTRFRFGRQAIQKSVSHHLSSRFLRCGYWITTPPSRSFGDTRPPSCCSTWSAFPFASHYRVVHRHGCLQDLFRLPRRPFLGQCVKLQRLR